MLITNNKGEETRPPPSPCKQKKKKKGGGGGGATLSQHGKRLVTAPAVSHQNWKMYPSTEPWWHVFRIIVYDF